MKKKNYLLIIIVFILAVALFLGFKTNWFDSFKQKMIVKKIQNQYKEVISMEINSIEENDDCYLLNFKTVENVELNFQITKDKKIVIDNDILEKYLLHYGVEIDYIANKYGATYDIKNDSFSFDIISREKINSLFSELKNDDRISFLFNNELISNWQPTIILFDKQAIIWQGQLNEVYDSNFNEKVRNSYVEYYLNSLTLEEKISQLMIVSVSGTKSSQQQLEMLEQLQPGGIIIFSNNISTYQDTLQLIKDIKSTSKIDYFMSVDQEGGVVQRLKSLSEPNASVFPKMYDVGQYGDLDYTYQLGKAIGEELRTLGFNLDFAPCADVFSNPNNTVIGKRSFGSDPVMVGKQTVALAKGLESVNIGSCYKHFPGHGNSSVDSHESLPIINLTKEQLLNNETIPFQTAIENDCQMIMIGHLLIPTLDDKEPASLSSKVITDFLKDELGYNGLVITDALNMGGVTNDNSAKDIYVKALNAGVDILLMPTNPQQAVDIIRKATITNEIKEERINEAVEKILLYKYDNILDYYDEYYDYSYLNSPQHQQLIDKIK